MNRKRFIYFTDLILIPLFILSLYTGIKLHIAGHHANHEIWHNWTVFHTIASLLFTIFGIVHIKSHWGWYKGLKATGCKGKKKVVLLFSITFALVIITGILLLLFVDGANSPTGLLHYKIGIATGVLAILHILKQKHFLYSGFKTNIIAKKQ